MTAGRHDRTPMPGQYLGGEGPDGAVPLTLEVDGERFVVRRAEGGGWAYEWVSGPKEGYGFGVSGPPSPSDAEHVEAIRGFLRMIDPATGYMGDD